MRFLPFTWLLLPASLVAQSAATADHIATIEHGLLPPVHVTNRAPMRKDLLDEMRALHVPAVSIAVIRDGKLEWAKAYGVVAPGGAAATPDTLFQAASVSKSVAAMGALHLVQTGKLSLDAPINHSLQHWKLPDGKATAANPVTLRELLSHTAGTNVHGFRGYAADEPVPTLLQVLHGVKPANSPAVKVEFVPGTKFQYSGGGFTVVQQAMLDATGDSFPKLMQTVVLKPLGMTHSTYEQPLPPALQAMAAQPAQEDGSPIEGGPHTYPEMAAAGLWTTPSDLAKWVIEMQRSLAGKANHVLSREMTQTMLTPVQDGYGLGVEVHVVHGQTRFSHGGSNAGYRSQYFADSDGNGVVIMTSGDAGEDIIGELLRAVASEYGWTAYRQKDRTAADVAMSEQQKFVGKYKSADGFHFSVSAEGDHLVVHFSDGSAGPFLPSDAQNYFSVISLLQVHFKSTGEGELIFAPDDREAFTRVQ